MGYAVLGFDGTDDGAVGRRMAVRDRHLAVITAWAASGRMALGVPLFDAGWKPVGSLMLLEVPDRAGLEAYLAEEPFAREGVWQRVTTYPFRIAPLPYRALPQPGAPTASARTHTVTLAFDGTDAEAPARRQAARTPHMARVTPMAEAGLVTVGGAILDESEARMIGSIAVTAHASDAEAEAGFADDPYVRDGVWKDVTRWGTRLAALPYRPLPGAAG
jgi:uncharacterized protein YciI